MPSSHTTRKRLEKQGVGENNNAWGGYLNLNTIDLVDEIFGVVCVAMTTAGDSTLSTQNGLSDEGRRSIIYLTGAPTTVRAGLNLPAVQSFYVVRNKMTGSNKVHVRNAGGTTGVDFSGSGSGAEQGIIASDGTHTREIFRTTSIGSFSTFTSAVIGVVSDATTDTTGGALADFLHFNDASETGALNKVRVDDFLKNTLANVSARTSVSPSDTLIVGDADGSFIAGQATVQKLHNAAFGLTAKTTLTGADTIPLNDTAASNVGKKITWTNLKTQLTTDLLPTQANMETGTSNVLFVTPGRQQFHDSAMKGQCSFDGTGTVTIYTDSDYNISSISDNGVGTYVANYTTAFSGANAHGTTCSRDISPAVNSYAELDSAASKTTTTQGLGAAQNSGGSRSDADPYDFMTFGDF